MRSKLANSNLAASFRSCWSPLCQSVDSGTGGVLTDRCEAAHTLRSSFGSFKFFQ